MSCEQFLQERNIQAFVDGDEVTVWALDRCYDIQIGKIYKTITIYDDDPRKVIEERMGQHIEKVSINGHTMHSSFQTLDNTICKKKRKSEWFETLSRLGINLEQITLAERKRQKKWIEYQLDEERKGRGEERREKRKKSRKCACEELFNYIRKSLNRCLRNEEDAGETLLFADKVSFDFFVQNSLDLLMDSSSLGVLFFCLFLLSGDAQLHTFVFGKETNVSRDGRLVVIPRTTEESVMFVKGITMYKLVRNYQLFVRVNSLQKLENVVNVLRKREPMLQDILSFIALQRVVSSFCGLCVSFDF